jgi:hypothetical protein
VENAGQIIRRRGGEIVEAEGENVPRGSAQHKKMLKMMIDPEMYMKTKDRTTKCPTQKATFLHSCTAFYTEDTRILQKPVALLSLFERWGTNPSLQNVETRGRGRRPLERSRDFQTLEDAQFIWSGFRGGHVTISNEGGRSGEGQCKNVCSS